MAITKTLHFRADAGATATYGFYTDKDTLRGAGTTVGSSTTTTALDAAMNTFGPVGVGDILWARKGNVTVGGISVDQDLVRRLTAKASETSTTVDVAWDLSATGGYVMEYQKLVSGTTVNDGWFYTAGLDQKHIKVNVDTLGSTTIVVNIEGRYDFPDAIPVQIVTALSLNATGSTDTAITADWPMMRVGLSVTGGPAVDSVSVYFEAASDNVIAL
jgi:hypothetical protein